MREFKVVVHLILAGSLLLVVFLTRSRGEIESIILGTNISIPVGFNSSSMKGAQDLFRRPVGTPNQEEEKLEVVMTEKQRVPDFKYHGYVDTERGRIYFISEEGSTGIAAIREGDKLDKSGYSLKVKDENFLCLEPESSMEGSNLVLFNFSKTY